MPNFISVMPKNKRTAEIKHSSTVRIIENCIKAGKRRLITAQNRPAAACRKPNSALFSNMYVFGPVDSAGQKKTAENKRQYYGNYRNHDIERIFFTFDVTIKEKCRD